MKTAYQWVYNKLMDTIKSIDIHTSPKVAYGDYSNFIIIPDEIIEVIRKSR